MQTAILGMDADAWEIRNSASLLYAALTMRILGFRNMQKVSKSQPLSVDGFQTCNCDSNGCNDLIVVHLASNMQETATKAPALCVHAVLSGVLCSVGDSPFGLSFVHLAFCV